MGDPFWLPLEQIAHLTDKQIFGIYLHARRRKESADGESPAIAGESEITYNGTPARPEDTLRLLAANGLLDRRQVEETIRGREEAMRRKGMSDGG